MTTTLPYTALVSQEADFQGWLDAHGQGIGASEIAAILGEHPFKSALRVWAEKTGALPPQDLSDVESVSWGLRLEPVVAEEFERRTGITVERWGTLLRSNTDPWALATPDYRVVDSNIPVQVKTTSAYRLTGWADGPPREVFLQVQQEMLVTGAPMAYVAVLVGGQRFMWAEVPRDEEAIAAIQLAGEEFWYMVQARTWPALEGSEDEALAIKELWPRATGEEIALPATLLPLASQLERVRYHLNDMEREETALSNEIKMALGAAEFGRFPDGSGFSYREQTRKAHWVKESTFRVLRRIQGV